MHMYVVVVPLVAASLSTRRQEMPPENGRKYYPPEWPIIWTSQVMTPKTCVARGTPNEKEKSVQRRRYLSVALGARC